MQGNRKLIVSLAVVAASVVVAVYAEGGLSAEVAGVLGSVMLAFPAANAYEHKAGKDKEVARAAFAQSPIQGDPGGGPGSGGSGAGGGAGAASPAG